jgi:hypothetical protein
MARSRAGRCIAARIGSIVISRRSRAAAMCGAMGSRKSTGFASGSIESRPAARSNAIVSSFAQPPSWTMAPAATGFIGTTSTPRSTSAWMSAHAASVLPTPVSVPVMNTPRVTRPSRESR